MKSRSRRTPGAAALKRRLRELELVIEGLHEGVYDWNVVTGELSYSDRDEVLGFPTDSFRRVEDWVARMHPDDREIYRLANVAHFKGVTPRFFCEYRYRALDGSWRWARTHGMAVRDRRGRAVRVVGSTGDITELKRAEQALRRSEERYALATSAAVEGIYEWDVTTGSLYLTERAKEFFSFPAEPLTPELWSARIHPQDFPGYRAALVEHFRGRTPHLEHEYRIRDGRDGYKWVLDHGIGVRNAAGRVTRMAGALSDITRRKRMQETLHLMSRLEPDVQPVLDTIARNAVELCGGGFGVVFRFDGEQLHFAASHKFSAEAKASLQRKFPMRPDRSQLAGRAILTGAVQRTENVLQDPEYDQQVAQGAGWRKALAVPLLHERRPLGAIAVSWTEPGPIPDWQIDVLKSLADQAVIALENARLLNETREALDRQTATAEILTVMSSSTTDVQPVFDAIVRNVQRLFGTRFAVLQLVRDGELDLVAFDGQSGFERITGEFPSPLSGDSVAANAIRSRDTVQLAPIVDNPAAPERSQRMARTLGYDSLIATPLVRADGVIGAIVTGHQDGRPFSDKQAALLKAFADQAVIAIENVRLFNETKEALEQQKAGGEVLSAISSSIADTAPVFDKILESCERLFAGRIVGLNLVGRDGKLHIGAYHGGHRAEFERIYPLPVTPDSGSGLCIVERRVVHYPDASGPEVPESTRQGCRTIGVKSVLFAPLLWEGRGVGAIFVGRENVSPFSERESALLRSFADQAAIAVENARLFRETRESLEGQTATADVLRVMSRSPGDVQPVFDAIAKAAVRLCEGAHCTLYQIEGGQQHFVAHHGVEAGMLDSLRRTYPRAPRAGTVTGLAILERSIVSVADCLADTRFPESVANHRRGGYRAVIAAPMLKDDQPIGVIFIGRRDARPFSGRQIELLRTFAAQAAIAIEHVRLFKHKSEFLAHMSHELRTPLNAIIGFTRVVMRNAQNRLEPKQVDNLEKIHASGERLLTLINSVLDLSRIDAGRMEVRAAEVGLAPLLEQCLRTVEPLVRAPAVKLERDFNGALPRMVVDEEKLRQIVVNLLGNAVKFTERGAVRLAVQAAGGSVAIAVSDTGIGIPAEKLDVIFEEFEQVDAGSTRVHGGSGLGLAIARRLARLMGGDITVESSVGAGSTFRVTLPLRYPAVEKSLVR